MKMILDIFCNGELINTIKSTEEKAIYKSIAQAYRSKDTQRAKVKATYTAGGIEKLVCVFPSSECTNNNVYKYIYRFENVTL